MTWVIKLLGIDKVRQAAARIAAVFNALADDLEEARLKLRGKAPPALTGPGEPAGGRKKAKAATT